MSQYLSTCIVVIVLSPILVVLKILNSQIRRISKFLCLACDKSVRAIPLKKVSRGGDHTPKKILRVGGLKNFAILRVGGIVRPPHIEVYGGNSAGGWSEQFCNSAGGWSEKNCDSVGGWSDNVSVVTLPTNFFNGIALKE